MSEKEETGKEAGGGRLTGEDILSEERCSRWKEPQAACCSSPSVCKHAHIVVQNCIYFLVMDLACVCFVLSFKGLTSASPHVRGESLQ